MLAVVPCLLGMYTSVKPEGRGGATLRIHRPDQGSFCHYVQLSRAVPARCRGQATKEGSREVVGPVDDLEQLGNWPLGKEGDCE